MNQKPILILMTATFVASLTNLAFANSEYEQWLRKTQDTFQEYKDKRDKEFTSFLKKQWKEMYLQPEIKKDTTPKPRKAPVLKAPAKIEVKKKAEQVIVHVPEFKPPQVVKPEPQPVITAKAKPKPKPKPVSEPGIPDFKKPVEIAIPEPMAKPVAPVESKKEPVISKIEPEIFIPPVTVAKKPASKLPQGQIINVSFFGSELSFSYDPKMKIRTSSRIDKNMISNFWSNLSRTNYELLQKQFNEQREPLALNDWGYVLLVNKVARAVYPRNPDAASMFTWFFLTKEGYKARIAYDSQGIILLLPSKQVIKQSHFTFAGIRYYPLNLENGTSLKTSRVKTYDGEYPGANSRLNMQILHDLHTGRKAENRTLKFTYRGKKYSVKVNYDSNTVNFLNTYPAMDYDTYFDSQVSQQTGHPLLVQLGKIIDGKSEEEAVNILLRFTQTAFKYKDDISQFGSENYLFPEETLHYPYSDCEDRVFMFAWLVKNLTGLKVVGLKYPGHFSAAVKFHENISGQSVSYQGQKYMMTEPTYKGGRVGQAPPQNKKARPVIAAITG